MDSVEWLDPMRTDRIRYRILRSRNQIIVLHDDGREPSSNKYYLAFMVNLKISQNSNYDSSMEEFKGFLALIRQRIIFDPSMNITILFSGIIRL